MNTEEFSLNWEGVSIMKGPEQGSNIFLKNIFESNIFESNVNVG